MRPAWPEGGIGGGSLLATLELDEIAARVFLAIAVVMVVARVMGAIFRRIRQPAVVGEILAGILLGPTLLGAFPGDLTDRLFPLEARPFLTIVAQLGLIIFMFIVGLELDVALIRGKERLAAGISASSVALPFALGFGLAAILHGSHDVVDGETVDFVPFALFIGASMSVTAFPVLARILSDRGMQRTEIGALVLACAAVDDILAWSLLAVVLAVVASSSLLDLPLILAESIAFIAVMFKIVRPQLERLAARYRETGRLTPDMLAVVLIGVLLSSFITSEIGIHSIFGAFLFGVIMPREETAALFHQILERLEQVSVLLLLPVFFIVTGLSVDVRGLGASGAGELVLVLVVACVGKFVGATVAGRAQGLRPRKAYAIGILMNTRGLTELVILNIGLAFGVLDRELFTMLVIMALFTTMITGPLLRVVYPDKLVERDVAEAELAALGGGDAFRVVVAFDDPVDEGPGLVDLAVAIAGDERPSELVLIRFLPSRPLEVGSGLSAGLVEMTDSLSALRALATRAEEAGVRAVVRSQFSGDIAHDVRVHASAIGVDVVLLGGSDPAGATGAAEALFADPPCTVVIARDPASLRLPRGADTVRVRFTGTEDSMAAMEIGVRLARATSAPLQLVNAAEGRRARRLATLLEALARAGVAAGTQSGDDDGRGPSTGLFAPITLDLVPADGRTPPSVPGLVVRAGEAAGDDRLTRLLERVADQGREPVERGSGGDRDEGADAVHHRPSDPEYR